MLKVRYVAWICLCIYKILIFFFIKVFLYIFLEPFLFYMKVVEVEWHVSKLGPYQTLFHLFTIFIVLKEPRPRLSWTTSCFCWSVLILKYWIWNGFYEIILDNFLFVNAYARKIYFYSVVYIAVNWSAFLIKKTWASEDLS